MFVLWAIFSLMVYAIELPVVYVVDEVEESVTAPSVSVFPPDVLTQGDGGIRLLHPNTDRTGVGISSPNSYKDGAGILASVTHGASKLDVSHVEVPP
jgi:hypothetical protein